MPAGDRKFKQTVPAEQDPTFLRSLADAFEGRTENPPPLVGDLSAPLSRLEIKAKAGAGIWEFKEIATRPINKACARWPKPWAHAEW